MTLLNKLKITLIIFSVSLLTLVWYLYDQHKTIVLKQTQIEALTDTVTLYRTKTGASGAQRKIFTGSRSEVLNAVKASDPKAAVIINTIKRVHSYTDFKTVTKIDTTVKAVVKSVKDSLTGKSLTLTTAAIQEPTGFYDAQVEVKKDSVSLQVHLNDQYHVISHEKSNGFFKPKSYVVDVTNENPYVTVTGVNSFEIKPKNKLKTGVKIGGIAVGLTAIGLLFLTK